MTIIIKIDQNAPFYAGSGHVIAAVLNGSVIDAVYGVDLSDEFSVRRQLSERHPEAKIVAGMMSCYELSLYDPSELGTHPNRSKIVPGADLNARADAFAALTTEQIKDAFATAGMTKSVAMHGNVYNQIRCGDIGGAIGTLKAGASARTQKDARKALRKALRPLVPGL